MFIERPAQTDDLIDVWLVEPGKGADSMAFDNPTDAGEYAGEVAEHLWDQAEPGDLLPAVTIRHATMALSEFEELEGEV